MIILTLYVIYYMIVECYIQYSLSRRKMKMLNKSSSMPSLVPPMTQKGMSSKPRKHKLQELENEVNKSRIAIVLLTLFRKI